MRRLPVREWRRRRQEGADSYHPFGPTLWRLRGALELLRSRRVAANFRASQQFPRGLAAAKIRPRRFDGQRRRPLLVRHQPPGNHSPLACPPFICSTCGSASLLHSLESPYPSSHDLATDCHPARNVTLSSSPPTTRPSAPSAPFSTILQLLIVGTEPLQSLSASLHAHAALCSIHTPNDAWNMPILFENQVFGPLIPACRSVICLVEAQVHCR
jgi:hypothetical protein